MFDVDRVLETQGLSQLVGFTPKHLVTTEHIKYDEETREMREILCRGCGVKIAGLVDDDVTNQVTERIDPGHVVTKMIVRQKFRRLGNLTQLHLTLTNGAAYDPMLCTRCAQVFVRNYPALDELWKSDLIEMIREQMASGRNVELALHTVHALVHYAVARPE